MGRARDHYGYLVHAAVARPFHPPVWIDPEGVAVLVNADLCDKSLKIATASKTAEAESLLVRFVQLIVGWSRNAQTKG